MSSVTCSEPKVGLVDLPTETILEVVELMTAEEQIVFGQVCRMSRAIVARWRADVALTREQSWRWILALGHDQPNFWECWKCLKIHHLGAKLPCGLEPIGPTYRTLDGSSCPWGLTRSRLRKIHKTSRLEDQEQEGHRRVTGAFERTIENPKVGGHSMTAKIYNGRLFMFARHSFTSQPGEDARLGTNLGVVTACEHMSFNFQPEWVSDLNRETPLLRAISLSQRFDGKTTSDSCRHCLTDFEVEVTNSSVCIRVWRDLGSEICPGKGSMLEKYRRTERVAGWGPESHQPGSVRKHAETIL